MKKCCTVPSSPIKTRKKTWGEQKFDAVGSIWENLRERERERALLSRNTHDPIVGSLRDKKENCSTRRGLRVGTRFREFSQTPRGRGFSLLEFYSHFECFTNV